MHGIVTAMEQVAVSPTTKANVLAILDAQGRSMTWLAERVGIGRTHLYLALSGEKALSAEVAQRLSDFLGVPLEMILGAQVFHQRNDSIHTTDIQNEPSEEVA